jgi:hypothetical protein
VAGRLQVQPLPLSERAVSPAGGATVTTIGLAGGEPLPLFVAPPPWLTTTILYESCGSPWRNAPTGVFVTVRSGTPVTGVTVVIVAADAAPPPETVVDAVTCIGAEPVAVPTPAVGDTCTSNRIAGYDSPGASVSLRVHVGVLAFVHVHPEPVGVVAVAGWVIVRPAPLELAFCEICNEFGPQVAPLTATSVLPDGIPVPLIG